MGAAKGPAKCQETVESDSLVRAVQLSEEDQEDGSAQRVVLDVDDGSFNPKERTASSREDHTTRQSYPPALLVPESPN